MLEVWNDGVKRDISANSRSWKDFDTALRRNGVREPHAYWHVVWAKRFKATVPDVPLGDRNGADVEGFIEAVRKPQLSSWQVEQASQALRILYQESRGTAMSECHRPLSPDQVLP